MSTGERRGEAGSTGVRGAWPDAMNSTMSVGVSSSTVRFEPMAPEDLAEVMEIERRVFDSPWTAGMFRHELKLPFSRSLVARADEERCLIGYACWWVLGEEAEILNVAVAPEHRRRGVGRALVRRMLDDAQAHGVLSVSLEVRRGNVEAVALYESFGFVPARVRKQYYGPGEDAIVMTCRLTGSAAEPA